MLMHIQFLQFFLSDIRGKGMCDLIENWLHNFGTNCFLLFISTFTLTYHSAQNISVAESELVLRMRFC